MIKIGDIYRIKMNPEDGITPKGTDTYRNKYIIIVGRNDNDCYGVVVTNTKDHPLIPIKFQYPLNLDGYKCYANCRKLFKITSSRLTFHDCKGKISDGDLALIIGCVQESDIIPKSELKEFGIIK